MGPNRETSRKRTNREQRTKAITQRFVSYEALRPPLVYEYSRRKKSSQQKTTTEESDVAQEALE